VDLGDDLYQVDLNFMGFGQVNGSVVVEGSIDGSGFNPIGEFASSGAGASLLGGGSGIEFSPVVTGDRVRYVRLNVQGSAELGFVVTVGGAQSASGGGAETLAAAYAVGVTSVDQTMIVTHSKGGKVVFDGTGLSAPDRETVEILGQGGYAALTMGPRNIGIGVSGYPPVDFNDATSSLCVAMGFSHVNSGSQCVAIGVTSVSGNFTVAIGGGGCNAIGEAAIAIGHGASAQADECIAIGDGTVAAGDATICIGFSSLGGDSTSFDNISLGRGAVTANPGDGWGSSNVAIGSPSYTTITNGSVAIGSGASAGGHDNLYHTDVGMIAIGYGADVNSVGASIGIGNGAVIHNTSFTSTNEPSIGIGDGVFVQGAGGAVVVGPSAITYSNRTLVCGLRASAFGDGSVSLGYGSQAGDVDKAPNAVAIGANSIAYEDSDISIGNGAHTDGTNSLHMHNIAIGNGAYSLGGASCIAVGDDAQAHSQGTFAFGHMAHALDAGCISIGYWTTAGVGADGAPDSTVIGSQSTSTSTADVVMGLQTRSINGGGNNVVIGSGALLQGSGEVAIGQNAGNLTSGPWPIGNFHTVSIGYKSAALDTDCIVLGPAAVAGVGNGTAQSSIAIGRQAHVTGYHGIALGTVATVTGVGGMAFGTLASAGANETVFGSTDTGVGKFEVISNDAASDDLFKFDVASVIGANDTALTLLIMKADGVTKIAVPVTIGAPNSGGAGFSALRVANT
jgi:Hep_Hag.